MLTYASECNMRFIFRDILLCVARVEMIENKMTRKINLILHSEAYVNIYLFHTDQKIRIFDARTNENSSTFIEAFNGCKEPRVFWLNDDHHVVTTGTNNRNGTVKVWDVRNPGQGPISEVDIGVGIGTLMPFFDLDTNLLVIAGKVCYSRYSLFSLCNRNPLNIVVYI